MGTNRRIRCFLSSLLLGAAACTVAPGQAAAAVTIGPGFTGAWFDPAQSGHGLFVEVLNNNAFLAWWFTFNPAGTGQSWFGGVGTYSGNTAVMTQVTQTTGGRWIPNFDPSKLVQIPWGTLTFTFTDCNNGKVDFNSTVPGYGIGSMTLSRLTLPAGLTCQDAVVATAAEGLWPGASSNGQTVRGIILDDGTYYILYSQSGNSQDAGVVQGTSSASNGQLTSSDGVDFPIAVLSETGDAPVSAAVSGTYVPRSSLQLTVVEGTASRTLSASYDPAYEQSASLAAIAGTYTGVTGHSDGKLQATFTLDSNGNLSGSNAACAFQGKVTPHKSVNVFDWTVSGPSGQCIFAKAILSGVLYYDQANRQIHGLAPYASRTDQWYLIGTKQ